MPQGYTVYGAQRSLPPAGSVVLSPGYHPRAYPAAHASPALMERLRQMQPPPGGYAPQQAPYLQPLIGSQR